jgi:hypothetical protein
MSDEARSQADDSEVSSPEGIALPMIDLRVALPIIDLRVAKYAAVANMRVLSVADDMARQEANLIDPSRPSK